MGGLSAGKSTIAKGPPRKLLCNISARGIRTAGLGAHSVPLLQNVGQVIRHTRPAAVEIVMQWHAERAAIQCSIKYWKLPP